MRTASLRRTVLLLGISLALSVTVSAQPALDLVRFATETEKARAHLAVSEELYTVGQSRSAALHAAHPVHEIGNRIIGPVRRTDPALADRLRAALREPGRALDGKVPPARYSQTVATVVKTLDEAAAHVLGPAASTAPAFRARVVAALLDNVADEYEESFKEGKIVQPVEYQDAYALFRRVRVLYDGLPAEARRADADVAGLAKALPGITPPATPMPAATLRTIAHRIATALPR